MGLGEVQLEAARALLSGFAAAGVTDAVICPGSRSTPLVLGALGSGLRCHAIIDERSAAFFALGQARLTGRPSLVICTSGTAAAHFFPAAIEAGLAHLPLILVTADRSPELQGVGALQTIDQVKLFGAHARAFRQVQLFDARPGARRALGAIAAQAVFASTHPLPGAVQVDVQAAKPLEPEDAEAVLASVEGEPRAIARRVAAVPPRLVPPAAVVAELAELVRRCPRGLIVAGPGAVPPRAPAPQAGAQALTSGQEAVLRLARATGYPLYAEASSQLRFLPASAFEGVALVDVLDPLMRAAAFRERFTPDVIVQLGMTPTAGGWEGFLEANPAATRVVVAPHGWQDPQHGAALILAADVEETARALADARAAVPGPSDGAGRAGGTLPAGAADAARSWAGAVGALAAAVRARVAFEVAHPELTEATLAAEVVRAAPPGSVLMVGNGLAIRHLDAFAAAGAADLAVLTQRGASGIDGLVSGAAGAASVADRPVTLLLGDVSLIHDLGGLAAVGAAPLVIVAIHNDGGRIFEQLPIARRAADLGARRGAADRDILDWFVTPHGRTFAGAAALHGVEHRQVGTRAALVEALGAAYEVRGCTLIEARVPPRGATEIYGRLWRDAEACARAAIVEVEVEEEGEIAS